MERKKKFQKVFYFGSNRTFTGQIWCGRRKRKKFLNLVMKSPVAVPIWCERKKAKRFLPKCTTPIVLMV